MTDARSGAPGRTGQGAGPVAHGAAGAAAGSGQPARRGGNGKRRQDGDASRVTLQDVADRAGVSLTTASRVLSNGPRPVGRQLVHRVNQAVAELGYTANLQARAVATGQSNMVGVVVHDISDPYFSSIAAGLIDVADRQRLLVCLSSTAAAEAGEREYVALMRSQRARAVILIGSRTDDQAKLAELRREIQAFCTSGGSAVCIGQDLLGVDTILPENAAGAEALGKALVVQGHRRFAVLAGPRGLLTARDRLTGFLAGLAAWSVSVDPRYVVHGSFSRDGGYEAMSTVLAMGGPRPDCVFAATDVMAVGALARLRAEGISVPGDIGLAGFDDLPTLRDVYPPLTTVRLPLARMGEMAARLVLNEASADRPRVVPVPGEVILRDSTLRLPPAR
ncbi:MAG TPA: LacI family DNA-binding transcriptional regulator [Streptosporangiaceae bacterium]|nr:LacI family DNA-binding transcriptional regulator [Streptosporangiaceae bacterium]